MLMATCGFCAESTSLSAVAAKKMKDELEALGSKVMIVDVRAESEFDHAHIPDAENISSRDEKDIAENLEGRHIAKDTTLLIYSGSGTRSGRVITALIEKKFTRVFTLEKGLRAWELEGFPIEKGK